VTMVFIRGTRTNIQLARVKCIDTDCSASTSIAMDKVLYGLVRRKEDVAEESAFLWPASLPMPVTTQVLAAAPAGSRRETTTDRLKNT
jgi:hypothetical protein